MQNLNPKSQTDTLVLPAEWAVQERIWTAWPSHDDPLRWTGGVMPDAQAELAQMVHHIANTGQSVYVLADGETAVKEAQRAFKDFPNVRIFPSAFGDIWLRDTGAIFAVQNGELVGLRFKNNGWGGKYFFEDDIMIGDIMAQAANATIKAFDFILEGGAIEHNGQGTILTTRDCVLNSNRNVGWTQDIAEKHLKDAFGAHTIIWLDKGMMNDHTDGHIDNIARFVSPDTVVCHKPFGDDDPNATLFDDIAQTLRDAGLNVVQIPSPGLYRDEDGQIVPASHMNFIIANEVVVMPTYDTKSQDEAIRVLQDLFPTRTVIGSPSKAIVTGGGSFHCITQQQPAL